MARERQASVRKMVTSRSKYKKCGKYVELRVGRDFAAEAAKAVNLEEDHMTFSELCLFISDGTRVPNTPINEWTAHNYMTTLSS